MTPYFWLPPFDVVALELYTTVSRADVRVLDLFCWLKTIGLWSYGVVGGYFPIFSKIVCFLLLLFWLFITTAHRSVLELLRTAFFSLLNQECNMMRCLKFYRSMLRMETFLIVPVSF